MNSLIILILLPLFSILTLILLPINNKLLLKKISLSWSYLIFIYSILLWIQFQNSILKFQFFFSIKWFINFNFFFNLGIDSISLYFILLTTFLIIICILNSWENISHFLKEYFLIFFFIEFFLLLIFSILDLFLFYFFFESILIPMFLLIGVWGSRSRKIKAAYLFFFYTLIGSITFLLAIIYILIQYGITSYPFLFNITFTITEEKFLWIAFFLAFATKVPMVPFHIWLPEAHVEAPTTGSVILAGILLKLGIYGFLRFLIPLFNYGNKYFLPLVYTLAILGIFYTALTALRQTDLKRIIAYSSISHMNFVILGIFSNTYQGIQGAILQSISHGFVSSGLFILVGFLYDRYHTRLLKYYSGLYQVMPLYSIFFVLFILSNIALPGTSSFIGEFLILLGSYQVTKTITIFATLTMVLGAIYSLWLLNRLIYGNLKTSFLFTYYDLTLREFIIISLLFAPILILGLYPNIILNDIYFLK